MLDSHCHLADDTFTADADAVIGRAREAGLVEALCIVDASVPAEGKRAPVLCAAWPALRTTAGVHPHRASLYAGRAQAVADDVRGRLAADPAARAVGEIGLDYHYDLAPADLQRDVFAAQVELALRLDLPVVVHTRKADDDTVSVLREAGAGRVRGVFHCFSGDVALARRALDLGFLVSFSGIVTFPKSESIREAATYVPADRLLMETDSPYLAPVPRRGGRNEPAWVTHVASRLSALRGVPVGSIVAQVIENYRGLFRP